MTAFSDDSGWHRWIDTSLPSPDDITPMDEALPVAAKIYELQPYSLVVLDARIPGSAKVLQAE